MQCEQIKLCCGACLLYGWPTATAESFRATISGDFERTCRVYYTCTVDEYIRRNYNTTEELRQSIIDIINAERPQLYEPEYDDDDYDGDETTQGGKRWMFTILNAQQHAIFHDLVLSLGFVQDGEGQVNPNSDNMIYRYTLDIPTVYGEI